MSLPELTLKPPLIIRTKIKPTPNKNLSSMVSALILHAFRVYLTGGFKKARELIWMTGIILGVCTVLFGVTGY